MFTPKVRQWVAYNKDLEESMMFQRPGKSTLRRNTHTKHFHMKNRLVGSQHWKVIVLSYPCSILISSIWEKWQSEIPKKRTFCQHHTRNILVINSLFLFIQPLLWETKMMQREPHVFIIFSDHLPRLYYHFVDWNRSIGSDKQSAHEQCCVFT